MEGLMNDFTAFSLLALSSLFLLLIVIMAIKRGSMAWLPAFFTWFGGVLADPNDKQGSTKRVCLLLVVVTILLLLVAITVVKQALPVIPDSILNLVYFLVATFTGGMVLDKGIAAYKASFENGADHADATDKQS